MFVAGVGVVIMWGALAFGAVYRWAYLPLLAACAVLGLIGVAVGWRRAPSRSHRAVLIALILVGAAAAAQLIPLPRETLRTISPAADAFLAEHEIGYTLLEGSHALSIRPPATVRGLMFLGALALFFAGMLRAFSASRVRHLVVFVICFGVVLALIGIIQKAVLGDHTFMGMKIYGFWVPESRLVVPYGPYVNRNHFAGWMLMALPLAIGWFFALWQQGSESGTGLRERLLWLSSPGGGRTVLVGFAIVVMTLSVVMSMSRSGMAALAVVAVLMSWQFLRTLTGRGPRIAALALIAALILAPVFWLGVDQTVTRFSTDSVGSVGMRVRVWNDTVRVIRDFPLTGTGLNTFSTSMARYQSGTRNVYFQEAHNDYLQIAAEGGLLVALPALIAILFAVRAIRRGFTSGRDDVLMHWIRVGATTALIAIALQSLVEFSLQMPGNAAFFTVVLAIAMHRPGHSRGDSERTRSEDHRP